jgi:hypothetical protein
MFGPNASFGVQTTSVKKLSVLGAFRFSEFRIREYVLTSFINTDKTSRLHHSPLPAHTKSKAS